jgi:hypothetical protein
LIAVFGVGGLAEDEAANERALENPVLASGRAAAEDLPANRLCPSGGFVAVFGVEGLAEGEEVSDLEPNALAEGEAVSERPDEDRVSPVVAEALVLDANGLAVGLDAGVVPE